MSSNKSRFFRFKRKWSTANAGTSSPSSTNQQQTTNKLSKFLNEARNDQDLHENTKSNGDCPDQPRPAKVAKRAQLTPLESQVLRLKSMHPGMLLMIECGYRFRFFGLPDAETAARVLDIQARRFTIHFPARLSRFHQKLIYFLNL